MQERARRLAPLFFRAKTGRQRTRNDPRCKNCRNGIDESFTRPYHFSDIGLRNARLNFRQVEEAHIMENILYNELRMRGYRVDVGVVEKRGKRDGFDYRSQLEIDFVANLGNRRYYVQSAFQIPDAAKEAQEKASLLGVDDSFKKIVLVRDVIKTTRDRHGITTMSVYDFLLDPNSLEA